MDKWKDFWNKKGWTTIKIRWLILWLFVLTVAFISIWHEYKAGQRVHTDHAARITELERKGGE